MKNYTFILLPTKDIRDEISSIRKSHHYTDALDPHLSLKTRFYLAEGGDYLKRFLENFNIGTIKGTVSGIRRLGDATALIIKSDEIKHYHLKMVDALNSVTTIEPQFERDGYIPHITLFKKPESGKDAEDNELSRFKNREITFTQISLLEMDPSPQRAWVKELHFKILG